MAILPDRDHEAMTKLLSSMRADRLARGAAGADEQRLVVGLEEQRARRDRHLAVGDDALRVRRADEAQIDREGDDGDAEQQDQVRDEIAEAPPLDHGSAPRARDRAGWRRWRRGRRRRASRPSAALARRASPITPRGGGVAERDVARNARGLRRPMRRPVRLGELARAAPCRAPAPSSSRSRPRRRDARRSWSSRISRHGLLRRLVGRGDAQRQARSRARSRAGRRRARRCCRRGR